MNKQLTAAARDEAVVERGLYGMTVGILVERDDPCRCQRVYRVKYYKRG